MTNPVMLSGHLSFAEMVHSDTALRKGIDNTPNAAQVERMQRLAATIFEPVRALLFVPLRVNSGYRSPALNKAVGGAKDSAHLRGEAVDFVPVGMDLEAAFTLIRQSNIPFDQCIIECGVWLHIALPREGSMPRRQALVASGSPGHWVYVPAPPLSEAA